VRQFALLGRVRVRILQISFAQKVARSLLEAVSLVLAVPDGERKWEFLPNAVLVHRPERPPSQPLGLLIVRLQPYRLQLDVRLLRELVRFDDVVQLFEVARVERDEGPRPEHRLAFVEGFARRRVDRQRPEEPSKAFHVAALLQRLADLGDLRRGEVQHRQRVREQHRRGRGRRSRLAGVGRGGRGSRRRRGDRGLRRFVGRCRREGARPRQENVRRPNKVHLSLTNYTAPKLVLIINLCSLSSLICVVGAVF